MHVMGKDICHAYARHKQSIYKAYLLPCHMPCIILYMPCMYMPCIYMAYHDPVTIPVYLRLSYTMHMLGISKSYREHVILFVCRLSQASHVSELALPVRLSVSQ